MRFVVVANKQCDGSQRHTARQPPQAAVAHAVGFLPPLRCCPVYTYTAASYLLEMRDSGGQVWWEADTAAGYDHLDRPVLVRKGHGHWTKRTYRPEDGVLAAINTGPTAGSGAIQSARYYSDGLGNLVSRADDIRGLSESFGYDSLNRLTKRNGATIVAYAINGNVTSKFDVNGAASGDYAYTGLQPHAVTSAFGYAMTYDNNGNLLTRTNSTTGESWATRWAGFDKPRWLAKTAYGATTGSEFIYNANRSRVVQMEFDSVNGSDTTATPGHYTRKRIYAWGATGEIDYQNLAGAGATPNWQLDTIRLYVPGPEGVIGAMEFAPNGPVEKTKRPLVYHYDHLGSVDTVTVLADRTTHVALDDTGKQSRHSFDPWGQRRDPDDWSGQPVNTTAGGHADVTPRGFTGHEMMDSLGLVNMNGRIYDGLLGRFLSADLMVSNPGSLQSFNRYSYCGNNPLTTTDPSGFESVIDERTRRRQAEEEVNGSSIRDRIVRNTSSNASTSAAQTSTTAANNAETVKPTAPERSNKAAPVVGQTTPQIASDTPAAKDGEQKGKETKPDTNNALVSGGLTNSIGGKDCVPVAWRDVLWSVLDRDPGDLRSTFSIANGEVDEHGNPTHDWGDATSEGKGILVTRGLLEKVNTLVGERMGVKIDLVAIRFPLNQRGVLLDNLSIRIPVMATVHPVNADGSRDYGSNHAITMVNILSGILVSNIGLNDAIVTRSDLESKSGFVVPHPAGGTSRYALWDGGYGWSAKKGD